VYKLSFDYPDKPALTIFARVNTINSSTIQIFRKINVSNIILGLESGDQRMLTATHKGTSVKMNKRAVKILGESKIGVFASFILGAPQENKRSLHNTLEFANRIKQLFDKTGTQFSIKTFFFTPRPGSIAFRWLLERTGIKYLEKDSWNRDELLHDWVDNFCSVGYNEIAMMVKEINSLN